MTLTLRAALLALPFLLSLPAFAADPDDDAAESQWTLPATPPPGTPREGSSEGSYADPDRRRMDEARRKGVLDQLCRHIKLNKDFSLGGGRFPVTTLGYNRRLETDFDNSLAMIDEETLGLGWSLGEGRPIAGEGTASLWLGGSINGKSMVVRRLGTFNTCSEVDRLLNVTDTKIIFPATPERIAEMGHGELWRIPLTINVGYGGSLSEAMDSGTVISLGYGKNKNGLSSMTLWRLSEHQARFRFRLDYVQIYSKSLGVSMTLDPIEFSTQGGNILSRFLKKQVARQLHRYTSAFLGLGSAESDGRRLVLEYVIDPTDPAQAQAMAEALRGNFQTLLSYARRMATSRTTPEETLEAFGDLQTTNTGLLGEPTYAARSDYGAKTRSFTLNLPFIVNRTVSEAFAQDRVTQFTGPRDQFEFHSANRTPNVEFFNMPFVGPLVKDLESRNVDVITQSPGGQGHGEPIAVYLDNHGFLRLPISSVAEMAEDANSILRLAGAARRGGPDRTMEIPAHSFFPPPQPVDTVTQSSFDGPIEPSDQKGWTSFTLVMNAKAVKDALSASTDQVLQAFARSIPLADRELAEWVVKNGKLEGGRLTYDPAQAKIDLALRDDDNSLSWMGKLAREAAGLALDMREAAAAPTPEDRAKALAKSFSHENRSGLQHRDILRVLVQFMDPLDLTGDFVSASDGTTKRALKVQAHYQLKQGRAEVPTLREAGATRGRFGDGSVMTD